MHIDTHQKRNMEFQRRSSRGDFRDHYMKPTERIAPLGKLLKNTIEFATCLIPSKPLDIQIPPDKVV